jgi:hypothetical protein
VAFAAAFLLTHREICICRFFWVPQGFTLGPPSSKKFQGLQPLEYASFPNPANARNHPHKSNKINDIKIVTQIPQQIRMSSPLTTQAQQNKQHPHCKKVSSNPLQLNKRSKKLRPKTGAFTINRRNPLERRIYP